MPNKADTFQTKKGMTREFKRKLDQPGDFKAVIDSAAQRRKDVKVRFDIQLLVLRNSCDVRIFIEPREIDPALSLFPLTEFSRVMTFDELAECTDVLVSHPGLSFPRPKSNDMLIELHNAASRLPVKLLQLPRLGSIRIINHIPDALYKDAFECQPWGPDVKQVSFYSYNEQEELPEAVFLTPSITHLKVTGSELCGDSLIQGIPLRLGDLPRLVGFDHGSIECSEGLKLVRAARALERLVASGTCMPETPWAALLGHDPRLLLHVAAVFNKFSI